MTQSAAETARLVREVDHAAVRVLYDQANLTFTHDEPYEEALRIQGDLVGHVHVKDLVFTDPNAPFQASETARVAASERAVRSRVIGDGVVPWGGILASLVHARLRRRPLPRVRVPLAPTGPARACDRLRAVRGRAPRRSSPADSRGERAMSAQTRTRIGIVGAGNIASIAQLPTLVERDDVELAALVSRRPDPGPLMRRWGFGAAYGTVEDMLTAEDLDAVFVLTPRSEHALAVDACLRRGVDVFCEKPLAPSADEAERLADLADRTAAS